MEDISPKTTLCLAQMIEAKGDRGGYCPGKMSPLFGGKRFPMEEIS
jgi:hypothetical protein